MKSKEVNKETIIPEINLASNMCYAMLEQMSKDQKVRIDDIDEVIDMAVAQLRLVIKQANRQYEQTSTDKYKEARTQMYEELRDRYDKACKEKEKHEPSDKEIAKAADAVQHLFTAYSMLENFLAKKEGRDLSSKKLMKMAQRLTRACFKDIEGVDVENISAEIHQDDNEITVEVIMPKNDED